MRPARLPPLAFREPAPDPEAFVRFECLGQTFDADNALLTHGLRLRLTTPPLRPGL